MSDKNNCSNLIPPCGGYQKLWSYRISEIIYDSTAIFCARFIDNYLRTTDQMIQTTRSEKQNIAEGCMTSVISKKTDLILERASLEKLLLDYEDYIRQHTLLLLEKQSKSQSKKRKML